MKRIQPARALQASLVLVLLLVLVLGSFSGCSTGHDGKRSLAFFNSTPQSIENKSFLITRIAVLRVLETHPNARPKLQIAADDLQILETAPVLNVEPILEIIQRLPPDTFKDPSTSLYVEAGILFFADELGTLAAQNPEQLRAAARGMRRGIESFLN